MTEVSIRTLSEQPTLVVLGKIAVEDMPRFFSKAYHAVAARAAEIGAEIAGLPFGRYRPLDCESHEFEVEAGFPVAGMLSGAGEVEVSVLPAGPAAVAWHIGPYESMVVTYDAVTSFLNEQHAEPMGPPWEVYHSDPSDEPDPAKWRTEIVQPFAA